MSLRFIQDGKGNIYNESENEPVKMKVSSEQFHLGDITNFDIYMDLRHPERGEKVKNANVKTAVDESPNDRDYTRHSNEKKNNFKKVYEKKYKAPQDAKELKTFWLTAYNWYNEDQEVAIKNQTNRDPAQQKSRRILAVLRF